MANVLDLSFEQQTPNAMHREPVMGQGYRMPVTGQWLAGDIIYNLAPAVGAATGWICLTSGCPGLWTTLPESVS